VAVTEEIVRAVRHGHTRLAALVAGLDDAAAPAATALPGWHRGHLLTHLINLSDAFVRQTEYARRGERVDVYDGGRPARDAAIEAGADRPIRVLRAELSRATGQLDQAWAALDPVDWERPVSYRDGTMRDVLLAQWREIEIHTTDLLLGYRPAGWTLAFVNHLMAFLAARVPDGTALALLSRDRSRRWELGAGQPVEIVGDPPDLATWLAGRQPYGPLIVAEGGPLPQLDPWP
jgi:maleylpyruvate isomerase